MVSPQVVSFRWILAHPIGKFIDVTARLEDKHWCYDRAIDFQHVFFEDEVLPPSVHEIGRQGTSRRTIVEEAAVIALEIR